MGRLKYPSSANPSDEDACAVWLHRSAILGSAALGEAVDAMVGLCFVCIYRIYTRFAWAGGTCPRFAWAGRIFSPVILLCQFLVLAGNRFWFYILLFMYLGYRIVPYSCSVVLVFLVLAGNSFRCYVRT